MDGKRRFEFLRRTAPHDGVRQILNRTDLKFQMQICVCQMLVQELSHAGNGNRRRVNINQNFERTSAGKIGAAPFAGLDKPLFGEFAENGGDRLITDLKHFGKLVVRGQLVSGFELSLLFFPDDVSPHPLKIRHSLDLYLDLFSKVIHISLL